jgi:hypothetical protein
MNEVVDFEVSNYILDKIAFISLNLVDAESGRITINLVNAGSVDKIVLDLQTVGEVPNTFSTLTINCATQCNLDIIASSSRRTHINELKLINAVLLKQPSIEVEYLIIQSSEAIKTALPIVTKEAEISVLPSGDMLKLQQLLGAVNIIPGSGEFVYDTKVLHLSSTGEPINSNNPDGVADSVSNLQSLKRICPNIKWTSPVVSWFGVPYGNEPFDRLDIANINIFPAVEYRVDKVSEAWRVGEYDRSDAHLISKDAQNRPNYGGTVNDASLVRYIEALNKNGYDVMFYPMIFMDTIDKPWRGHLKAGNADNTHEFFTKKYGYNQFILHYANLLKGKIDAFVIGSEFKDLTQTVDDRYTYPSPMRYPAVMELIELAKQVKAILGPDVIITYAADWSEYHHDKNGYHHLDILWASSFIDVIGIDAYLPLV